MEKGNVFESLGNYMRDVFDKDGDGIVSIKELFGVFPNMAIPIAIMFVDILVLAAEYRVWDFGYHVTGDEILAVGFVLVSAVPFLLGQMFWLYPRANFFQRSIAVGFIVLSLYTSAKFGLADLTKEYNETSIFTFLVELTATYIISTLIYIVIDPTIKMNRMKKKAIDAAQFENEKQGIARSILGSLKNTLEIKRQMENDFGTEEVAQALEQLSGKKKPKPAMSHVQTPQPRAAFAATVKDETGDFTKGQEAKE